MHEFRMPIVASIEPGTGSPRGARPPALVTSDRHSRPQARTPHPVAGRVRFHAVVATGGPCLRASVGGKAHDAIVDIAQAKFLPTVPVLAEHGWAVGRAHLSRSGGSIVAHGWLDYDQVKHLVRPNGQAAFSLGALGETLALKAGQTARVNGRAVQGPCKIFTSCTVREISITAEGADPRALGTVLLPRPTQARRPAAPAKRPAPPPPPARQAVTANRRLPPGTVVLRNTPGNPLPRIYS